MPYFIFKPAKKKILLLLTGILFAVVGEIVAQVSIAPTSLFFNPQSRFSSLTISNGGQQAQEVTISTEFGFPSSRNGSLVIIRDPDMGREKSLGSWLKVFPQKFTLQPNQRQVVRFATRPPHNLETGGYWSRVKISSNPVSPPVEMVNENQVGAQINLVVEQVITAHYHTSNAQTGVRVNSVDFATYENVGVLSIELEQTGNSPFVGSIGFTIRGPGGETVYQANTSNSVYTTITRVFRMDTSGWESGRYTVEGTVSSERRDINQKNLLQIEPVSFTKEFSIN